MKAVVVIPAYNEARTIRDLVQRTLVFAATIVVVDDGSADRTADAVSDLPVTLLRHEVNQGKAAALATGFAWALANGAEAVVTLDGDGQHRPEDVPRLLGVAALHRDRLVIAARLTGRDAYPRARNFANRFADFWVSWAAGHRVVDSQCGQRVYPAALLHRIAALGETSGGFTFESEVVIRAAQLGFTTIAMPIAAIHVATGRASHFRPARDIARIVRMVAGYLLRAGLNPRGLWRSLRASACIVDPPDGAQRAGASVLHRPSSATSE